MIDWLKRDPRRPRTIPVAGRELPLVIRRLAQARRMTLRLAPDGSEARLSIPRWGSTIEAVAFARSRADWLADQIAAMPAPQPPGIADSLPYRGERLAIVHAVDAPRKAQLETGAVRLGGPADTLPARLRRWLESEARRLLSEDLAHYCALAGRDPPRLALSNARRRWGSCAADGAIRINWRLVMAPDRVRRSVVAHEVAHLVHFDHSPRFHALLGDIFEDSVAEANAWLKREGPTLYQPFG